MQLKWTSKALSDLARLYELLAPVNKPAAARTVQSLATAPASLLANPRAAKGLKNSTHAKCVESSLGITKCATTLKNLSFTFYGLGIREKIANSITAFAYGFSISRTEFKISCDAFQKY
ncbi:ParE toxin of type II toxin-antitoxin system, parDE [Nitrosospira sp. Nl5]|uniref:type II toxin-antitoxin system RelE/ParE family toxin n=1 Tax=Nitrosospira sp. Nl5 TaxID=200120 RepID=UPI000889DB78|nr:type II toxin-antitoxin system RelE/ParE family toxin [Nitrosospira sp. Nl5]SCY09495.1 ParE toxin of type II toxin-antitoxin system, parDE [Nitrosospira sp. Nl5]